jgi:predicted phosphodiesterase
MEALKLNPLTYELKYGHDENIDLLLCSDIHFDNPKCNRELFFNHLKRIKDRGGKVLINGDLLCVMQGKYDPRRSKHDIRPEHNKADYINAVINDTVDQLSPYADIIAFIGQGNHETAILKNLEIDLLAEVCARLNERNKVNIMYGGYRGWIVIRKKVSGKGMYQSYKVYYNHGFGGGGEMTKGILQHSRTNMYIENADAIWYGHVHESYVQPSMTEYFDNHHSAFRPRTRTIYNIRTACYKEEFADVTGGFHIERGRPPKPMGGVHMNLELTRDENNSHIFYPSYTIWT